MCSYRPDDQEWAWFWSDTYDGLAHRNFPRFWTELRTRCPDGSASEVIDAWTVDELQAKWLQSIYRGQVRSVREPERERPGVSRRQVAISIAIGFFAAGMMLIALAGLPVK